MKCVTYMIYGAHGHEIAHQMLYVCDTSESRQISTEADTQGMCVMQMDTDISAMLSYKHLMQMNTDISAMPNLTFRRIVKFPNFGIPHEMCYVFMRNPQSLGVLQSCVHFIIYVKHLMR